MQQQLNSETKVNELAEITVKTDTRDILAHATIQAEAMEDYFLVDIDAHVTETSFWNEIIELIDNDVIRQMGQAMASRPGVSGAAQRAAGRCLSERLRRIPHQLALSEAVDGGECHHFTSWRGAPWTPWVSTTRWCFPRPCWCSACTRRTTSRPPSAAPTIAGWSSGSCLRTSASRGSLSALQLAQACDDIVRDFGDAKGVIGFTVTCTRNKPVHHDQYMKLYAMIEEMGKPLAFHSGFHWGDPSFLQLNRFISMHALSFVHYSLIHLTNWIINGLPERFPKLKLVWVESGLAWMPFIMQRLDHEFMMRVCEAPMLKRPPSEYIREMYFTSQPLERSNLKLLEATFDAMKAETQLLFASDWPHWDFDPPSSITTIPFLSEQAKRNILGLNAAARLQPGGEAHAANRPRRQGRRRAPGGASGRPTGPATGEVPSRQPRPGVLICPLRPRQLAAEFHGSRMRLPTAARALASGAPQRSPARMSGAHDGHRQALCAKAEAEARCRRPCHRREDHPDRGRARR